MKQEATSHRPKLQSRNMTQKGRLAVLQELWPVESHAEGATSDDHGLDFKHLRCGPSLPVLVSSVCHVPSLP